MLKRVLVRAGAAGRRRIQIEVADFLPHCQIGDFNRKSKNGANQRLRISTSINQFCFVCVFSFSAVATSRRRR